MPHYAPLAFLTDSTLAGGPPIFYNDLCEVCDSPLASSRIKVPVISSPTANSCKSAVYLNSFIDAIVNQPPTYLTSVVEKDEQDSESEGKSEVDCGSGRAEIISSETDTSLSSTIETTTSLIPLDSPVSSDSSTADRAQLEFSPSMYNTSSSSYYTDTSSSKSGGELPGLHVDPRATDFNARAYSAQTSSFHAPYMYDEEDVSLYEQRICLSPWRCGEHDIAERWCKNIEHLLDKDHIDSQTTVILMQDAETTVHADLINLTRSKSPVRRGASENTANRYGLLRKGTNKIYSFFRRYRQSLSSTAAANLDGFGDGEPSALTVRYQSHFRRVLGSNRYLRIRIGIRIWVFFLSGSLERYRFYLSDEGEFLLSKEAGSCGENAPRHLGLRIAKKKDEDLASAGAGRRLAEDVKELPLEKLRFVDVTEAVRALLKKPSLKKVGANTIAALWNDNCVDPLIIASDRQADITDIIFVIRFVQHYKGLALAQIVEDS